MLDIRTKFLIGTILSGISLCSFSSVSLSEDCTGVLPTADCTLDEDTTAPLTIDTGITLTVGGSVFIDETIDGDDALGDGVIETFGGPNNITQSADIGATTPIDALNIRDDNTWTTSATINTDSSGSDIDLGAADGGETLNFITGGGYSGEIDGNGADTVNFGSDGAGGDFVTGGQIEAVTVIITNGASLQVNNTVGGGIGLGGLTIEDNASINTQANITSSGALDLDGELIIASGNTVFADSYVADADAGEIVLEVSRALGVTNTGRLNVSNGGLDLSNDTVEIAVAATTEGLIDETIVNAIVGNTAAAIGPGQFIDDSFLYDFELVANGNNFDLVITANSINGITDTANNLIVANTIFNNLADVDSEALGQLRSALGSASSQAEFNDVLESVQPTVDGGYAMASLNIRNDVTHAINNRVNTLFEQRKFPQKTKKIFSGGKNLVTGRVDRDPVAEVLNEPKGSAWIQPFVKSAAQSQKDGIEGYDLNTTGIIIGADTGDLRKDNLLGMTLVAARSDVDSDNANATQTQIDTYGVSIFGGAKMSAKTLLSGSLSYAQSDNDTRRTQIAGIAENVAEGDFFTQHIGFNSKVSHRYKTNGNWTFTPSASVDYDYIFANSYNETGDTDLALSVDYDALNMLALGVGLDVDYLYKTVNGVRINPSAYARYKYDFLNRGVRATSILRAASETPDMPATLINTAGFDPQRSVFNMGGNVEAELTDVWRLAMGYDLGLRKDYIAHTGHVNLLRKF